MYPFFYQMLCFLERPVSKKKKRNFQHFKDAKNKFAFIRGTYNIKILKYELHAF